MASENVIEVASLVKDFGQFRAVDGISFSVPRGKIVGFLGPNGAGKTTTIHILLGITTATSGQIHFFGQDYLTHKRQILSRINFTSAFNTLQGRITVWENLVVFALLYNRTDYKKRVMDLVDYFEIADLLTHRYMDLSAGQKTRVNIIKSLINDPEIILMDEPTASLDPDIADKTLTLIEQLKKDRNLTLLYTSHNMEEVTRICDDVIFLDHGKIVAHDTPLGLTKQIKSARLRLTFDGDQQAVEKYLTKGHLAHDFPHPSSVTISVEETLIPKIILDIDKTGVVVTDIEVEKPNLEDVFLQIARKKTI